MSEKEANRIRRVLALTRESIKLAKPGTELRANLDLMEIHLEVVLDEVGPGFGQEDIDMVMKRKGSAA